MKKHFLIAKWILVVGGLITAYEALVGSDPLDMIFGSLAPMVDVVVFGGAAVLVGYHLLNMTDKK